MDDTLILTFEKPIVVGGATFESITLTQPLVGQLREAARKPNGMDGVAKLIELIGKVPASVVDQICQRDFQRASSFLDMFNNPLPTTSTT